LKVIRRPYTHVCVAGKRGGGQSKLHSAMTTIKSTRSGDPKPHPPRISQNTRGGRLMQRVTTLTVIISWYHVMLSCCIGCPEPRKVARKAAHVQVDRLKQRHQVEVHVIIA